MTLWERKQGEKIPMRWRYFLFWMLFIFENDHLYTLLCTTFAHPSRMRPHIIYPSTSPNHTFLNVTRPWLLYRSEWDLQLDLNWSLIKTLKLRVKNRGVRMISWTQNFVHRSDPSCTVNPLLFLDRNDPMWAPHKGAQEARMYGVLSTCSFGGYLTWYLHAWNFCHDMTGCSLNFLDFIFF